MTLATDLTEHEQERFECAFYLIEGAPHDRHDEIPWGQPWLFGKPVTLFGETPEEMAVNFFDECEEEISEEALKIYEDRELYYIF